MSILRVDEAFDIYQEEDRSMDGNGWKGQGAMGNNIHIIVYNLIGVVLSVLS